jgi:transcriptional regulator with XRE-family HTH domain
LEVAVSQADGIDVVALGRRITRRRERLGIKQAELARRAQLSEAYINRLENGIVRNPKINDLAQVAGSLQVPLGAVLQDVPTPIQPELPSLLAQNPRLSDVFASLARGLELVPLEDRQFVFEQLEALSRRFGDQLEGKDAARA